MQHYASYTKNKYGTVIFDGYLSGPSTKDHEHDRRGKHTHANVQLTGTMLAHGPQQSFLSNGWNKAQFIYLLTEVLVADGDDILQVENDADVMIVSSALVLCQKTETVVISDATDILVLMIHNFRDMKDLYTSFSKI